MGILDAFRSKKVDVKPKRGRSYSGAATGRLFSSSFGASERSADSELQSALPKLRSRSYATMLWARRDLTLKSGLLAVIQS